MPLDIRNPSSPQFRRYAVARIRETGRTIREVAGSLGISYVSLRAWQQQEQTDLDEQGDRLNNHERVEVRELIHEMHNQHKQGD
jgi:transposase-like protein